MTEPTDVSLRAWTSNDLDVLIGLNSEEATAHLGGPESDEQVSDRLQRYLTLSERGDGEMFVISVDGDAAGSVGYWPREWHGNDVYETGWGVLPAFRRRGIARSAVALMVDQAREHGSRQWLHAFPSPLNGPSNAVCRSCGFVLIGEESFEYPPGHQMQVNDWQLSLPAERA